MEKRRTLYYVYIGSLVSRRIAPRKLFLILLPPLEWVKEKQEE